MFERTFAERILGPGQRTQCDGMSIVNTKGARKFMRRAPGDFKRQLLILSLFPAVHILTSTAVLTVSQM